jgi:hypothetical protein
LRLFDRLSKCIKFHEGIGKLYTAVISIWPQATLQQLSNVENGLLAPHCGPADLAYVMLHAPP